MQDSLDFETTYYDINTVIKHPLSDKAKIECEKIINDKEISLNGDYFEFACITYPKIKNQNLFIIMVFFVQFYFLLDDHLEKNHKGICSCFEYFIRLKTF